MRGRTRRRAPPPRGRRCGRGRARGVRGPGGRSRRRGGGRAGCAGARWGRGRRDRSRGRRRAPHAARRRWAPWAAAPRPGRDRMSVRMRRTGRAREKAAPAVRRRGTRARSWPLGLASYAPLRTSDVSRNDQDLVNEWSRDTVAVRSRLQG
ncbi:hypothetical protein E0E62_09220 [Streptomyces sp. 16-176A]